MLSEILAGDVEKAGGEDVLVPVSTSDETMEREKAAIGVDY